MNWKLIPMDTLSSVLHIMIIIIICHHRLKCWHDVSRANTVIRVTCWSIDSDPAAYLIIHHQQRKPPTHGLSPQEGLRQTERQRERAYVWAYVQWLVKTGTHILAVTLGHTGWTLPARNPIERGVLFFLAENWLTARGRARRLATAPWHPINFKSKWVADPEVHVMCYPTSHSIRPPGSSLPAE